MNSEDQLIFTKIQQGDEASFKLLFTKYYVRLCTFGNRFIGNMPDTQELVSEVFMHIWENRELLIIASSLKSYLFKMVQNKCLNYIKHKNIENEYIKSVERNFISSNGTMATEPVYYSDRVIEMELESEIERAIESLPEKCREIFQMSRYDQLKYTDISKKLNLSEKTVERQMGIALFKLREKLKDYLVIFF
jgi:RNA polymerase sigma-70 factor (family 1)